MGQIIEGFGQFLPYVFELLVVGLIWDRVVTAFTGGYLK